MSEESYLQERIKKRCLALARDLIKIGTGQADESLLIKLLRKAFEDESQNRGYRKVYDWLIKHKYDSTVAWTLSGLASVVEDSA